MSIRTATVDGVATIEIARPEKKNALTQAMYSAMAEAIAAADADPAVRAVLITGQPGVFTSGNDLEDFMKSPPRDENAPVFQFMKALADCGKPVVAAVTGAAIAAYMSTVIAFFFSGRAISMVATPFRVAVLMLMDVSCGYSVERRHL